MKISVANFTKPKDHEDIARVSFRALKGASANEET